jgi:hypothetical protein
LACGCAPPLGVGIWRVPQNPDHTKFRARPTVSSRRGRLYACLSLALSDTLPSSCCPLLSFSRSALWIVQIGGCGKTARCAAAGKAAGLAPAAGVGDRRWAGDVAPALSQGAAGSAGRGNGGAWGASYKCEGQGSKSGEKVLVVWLWRRRARSEGRVLLRCAQAGGVESSWLACGSP